MALRRLSTSSIQTNGKSSKLWDQTTFQSGMFALATVSLGTSTSTITFADIPQDYTHLQIRYGLAHSAPGTGPSSFTLRFNSDSTAGNYSWHKMSGDGATAIAGASTSATGIGIAGRYAISTGDIQAAGTVDILDYKSTTKVKTIRNLGGFDTNGAGTVTFSSGIYSPVLSTTPAPTAITSITITLGMYSYYANGIVALYGIKSA